MSANILIVEDDTSCAKMLCFLLRYKGYTDIVETNNGANVHRLAQEYQPTLIVMDMKLPDISGVEVARTLKSDQALNHIPIIAITASCLEKELSEVWASGCNECLVKPFHINDFMVLVEKFVSSGSSLHR